LLGWHCQVIQVTPRSRQIRARAPMERLHEEIDHMQPQRTNAGMERIAKQRIAYNLTLLFGQDQIKPSFHAEAIATEGIGIKRRRQFSLMGR